MASFSEIDGFNLAQLAEANPNVAIHLTNTFFGGDDQQPCGFVPNDWNGQTLGYSYKDK